MSTATAYISITLDAVKHSDLLIFNDSKAVSVEIDELTHSAKLIFEFVDDLLVFLVDYCEGDEQKAFEYFSTAAIITDPKG